MKIFQLNGKKYLLGLEWVFSASKGTVSESELKRVFTERTLKGDVFGVTTSFKSETIDKRTIVTSQAGFGYIPSELSLAPESSNPRKYYSLGSLVARNIANGLIIIQLDNGDDESWWFCAVYKGAVVPGTDKYGSNNHVMDVAKGFVGSVATSIYGRSELEKVRLFSNVQSVSTSIIDEGMLADINFELDPSDFIEELKTYSSNGVKLLHQLVGVDKVLIKRAKRTFFIAALVAVLGASGIYGYSVLTKEEVQVAETATERAERLKALREERDREANSAFEAARLALWNNMVTQVNESVLDDIGGKENSWIFEAFKLFKTLPVASHGYAFSELHCDHTGKCKVYWTSRDEGVTLPLEFETKLNLISSTNKAIHSPQADAVSKIFNYDTSVDRVFDFNVERNELPNVIDYTSKFLNLAQNAKTKGLVASWTLEDAKLIQFESEMPKKTLNNFKLEPFLGGYYLSSFSFNMDNVFLIKPLYLDLLDEFKYLGVTGFSVVDKKGVLDITIRGRYIANEK